MKEENDNDDEKKNKKTLCHIPCVPFLSSLSVFSLYPFLTLFSCIRYRLSLWLWPCRVSFLVMDRIGICPSVHLRAMKALYVPGIQTGSNGRNGGGGTGHICEYDERKGERS